MGFITICFILFYFFKEDKNGGNNLFLHVYEYYAQECESCFFYPDPTLIRDEIKIYIEHNIY